MFQLTVSIAQILQFILGVHLDSFILLGKLHFAQGMYAEALQFYEKAQIEALEEKHLPPRSLKVL